MSDNASRNLLLGFLSGALVGGIVALLYAPKTGKEFRGDLKRKGGEIIEDVDEYLQDAQEKAKHIINEGKEKSSALITDAKKRADSLLHDAEDILSGARNRVSQEGDKLKSAFKAGVDTYKEERDKGKEAPSA
ncbi:MAG: YtxH domain-containing protein [Bacteroidetes bacterium]|nr:YtxH domain-containing protein [Bacteroidota bacterium]